MCVSVVVCICVTHGKHDGCCFVLQTFEVYYINCYIKQDFERSKSEGSEGFKMFIKMS